ncbi:hypothetical protein B0H17DRAFT_1084966 [Mycena rosella]|uniref:Uncharacterized protein n=1 Tax=Mycena rosella TaxID=1033263 RepID=A0AAD7D3C6_MYCRO|nr:hypothetical protein B0H17DRAFT_1084966 [Mycena rosella]
MTPSQDVFPAINDEVMDDGLTSSSQMMPSDVSAVSNETSILTSLNNLLPSSAFHAILACIFFFALLLYALQRTALSKTTEDLHAVICSLEWIYYESAEAGLLEGNEDISRDLADLRTKASVLREQSLRSSLSVCDAIRAYCCGLSFSIMRCTKDVRVLRTRIEIARETGLRSISEKQQGQPDSLVAIRTHWGIAKMHCSYKL